MSTEGGKASQVYRNRLDESGRRILDHARERAYSLGQHHISVGHILGALESSERESFNAVLNALEIDPVAFHLSIEGRIKNCPRHSGQGTRLDPEVIDLFRRALDIARGQARRQIGAADLLAALPQDEQGSFIQMLREFGVSPAEAAGRLRPLSRQREMRASSPEREEWGGFATGDMVRIRSGAFAGFTGRVLAGYPGKPTLDVVVTFRGRTQNVKCDFSEVERLTFQRDSYE